MKVFHLETFYVYGSPLSHAQTAFFFFLCGGKILSQNNLHENKANHGILQSNDFITQYDSTV